MKPFLLSSLALFLLMPFVFGSFFQIVRIHGTSMEPLFESGDMALASKTVKTLQVGDIVVFKMENNTTPLIKRVVALGGGQWLASDGQKYEVPPGHVFVLGDNRDYSDDSRVFGAIPREALGGKVYSRWKIKH